MMQGSGCLSRFVLTPSLVGLALIVLANPAQALKIRSSDFAELCGGKVETMQQDINRVICISYLQGLIDAHDAMGTLFPPTVLFCAPPPGVEVDHARQTFLAWIAEKPDYRGRNADVTIISALNAAFPCAN